MNRGQGNFGSKLQHPRRSLGDRHRTQAEKFLKLGIEGENISWAEQNAKQSVLYDFTNPKNWRLLIKIKIINTDNLGIKMLLEDLFNVLGRDNALLEQLQNINLVDSGEKLLDATFEIDPLDPELWWERIKGKKIEIEKFAKRLKQLDTRDYRSNILFSRRIQIIKNSGYEELFLELSRYLLAQRPANHEVWNELGKLHERRKEYDQAWFSYDQAQIHFPKSKVRDEFKIRMENLLEGTENEPWTRPKIDHRIQFLKRMEEISYHTNTKIQEKPIEDIVKNENIADKIENLIKDDRISEAFFLARSLAAKGDEEAKVMVDKILKVMEK